MVDQGDLAQQSLVQYRSTWRCHVRTRWQETPADMVRPIDVQQWLIGLSRVAAEASLHLMRQIMDYPTRYGLISSNPLAIRYLLPSPTTTSHREDGVGLHKNSGRYGARAGERGSSQQFFWLDSEAIAWEKPLACARIVFDTKM
jgi:hypothetical protein